jgi:single-strand DNA-binding protein
MSYISRTGNLAAKPELREGDKGPYTYARVLVTDRTRQDDGTYADGATVGYDVLVTGGQARELVATAERSGNVRVTFSGDYRVTEWAGQNGTRIQHEVRADEVGVSLRGQVITVERAQPAAERPAAATEPTDSWPVADIPSDQPF